MITKEYYKRLDMLKDLLGEHNDFKQLLSMFASAAADFEGDFSGIVKDNAQSSTKKSNWIGVLSRLVKEEKKLSTFGVITQTRNIVEEVNKSITDFGSRKCLFLVDLIKIIDDFEKVYERHVREYSLEGALELAFVSNRLIQAIGMSRCSIASILANSSSNSKVQGEELFEIYLSNVSDFSAFATKLRAIDLIYSEMLVLHGLSKSDNPLLIEHLQNGSLWAKLSGNPMIVAFMTIVFSQGAEYLHSQFLETGKIAEISETTESLDKLLKITESLERSGANMDDVRDNLAKSAHIISKNLTEVLADQPTVEINERVIDLGDSNKNKMLEISKVKSLGLNQEL